MDKHYPTSDGTLLCGAAPSTDRRNPNWTGSPVRVTCDDCKTQLNDTRMIVQL